MKYKNVFSINDFNIVGGVESFAYYMAKMYGSDFDITFFYKTGHPNQIKRLKRLCRVIRNVGQELECERLFMNYDISVVKHVKADEYYEIIHGDYERQGIIPKISDKVDHYFGCSDVATQSWIKKAKLPCKTIANPLCLDKPKRVLHFISATRLSREKGRDRMIRLGNLLNNANIPYLWTIFTDSAKDFDNPNMILVPPRLDITDYIADADYLVQLSDSEASCYAVAEALALGTPVITTDLPTFREQGVKDGETGYLFPLEGSDFDVKKIYNKIPKFTFNRPPCEWDKLLVPGKPTYKEELEKTYIVEATNEWKKHRLICTDLNHIPEEGEQFEVDGERLMMLLGENRFNKTFVKVIKEKRNKPCQNNNEQTILI